MQLSPRQYQVDPTGSAYVQDTRPLMAAMGAQAASQIESNRMMTETMQRGMQGIEDFAARRQLAAARAQLGALNIEDESYGQKLSELVMDNPLAFTNRKTAAVANMAFKQAGEDFRNKRDNEMRMAMQAQEFSNSRTLASMSQANQMEMARRNRAADIKSMVFQEEAKVSNKTIDRLDELLTQDLLPEERAAVEKQRNLEVQKVNNLGNQFEQEVFSGDMAPLPQYVPAEGQTFGAGETANLRGASLFPDTSVPPTPMDAVPESGAPFTESGIQIPAAGAPQVAAPLASQIEMEASMAPAAEAPAAAPVSTGLTPQEQALIASAASRGPRTKKKDDTMTASELADKEKFTEDLSYADPEISTLSSEVESLKNTADALKTVISNTAIPSTEQQNKYLEAVSNLGQKQFRLARIKANFRTGVRFAGGPEKYVALKIDQEKKAMDEALKANDAAAAADPATAAANARLASAFAGVGSKATPAPLPDPTIGMSALEKDLYNIESKRQEGPLKRKAEQEARMAESNQQWSQAKDEVYKLIGGSEGLAEILGITEQPLIEGLDYGVDLALTQTRTANALAQKIREKIATNSKEGKLKGFTQKLERLGFQDVSQEEIIAAVVDEIIRGQKTASEKVDTISRASAAQAGTPIPQPVRQALGNTELIPR